MAANPLDPQIDVHTLYERVLHVANVFLHNCKHYQIKLLQLEDPTYEAVAGHIAVVGGLIQLLAPDTDPLMGQKAAEYCELMTKMGVAIKRGDQVALLTLVTELERKPGT